MRKYLATYLLLLFSTFLFGGNSNYDNGVLFLSEKKYEQARTAFVKASQEAPDFSTFYNLGIANGKLNNWKEARWAFEAALKYKPASTKGQFNAAFALAKIDESLAWNHPYSWMQRFVLGVHTYFWIFLVFISASGLATFIYLYSSKANQQTKLYKVLNNLTLPLLMLFFLAFGSLVYQNNLRVTPHYALVKSSKVKTFISPNGIEVDYGLSPKERLVVIDVLEDHSWACVKTEEGVVAWVNSNDLFSY